VALIRAHWSEILRIVASIRTGTVTASLIMRQLASYPRQNGVAAALRELGRLERTLFTLDWIERSRAAPHDRARNSTRARPATAWRARCSSIGSAKSATAPTRTSSTAPPASTLLVTAIILWNTRYLERAVAALRQTEDVPDHLLAHLSPLGWEHVNLTGDYVWGPRPCGIQCMSENTDGLRSGKLSIRLWLRPMAEWIVEWWRQSNSRAIAWNEAFVSSSASCMAIALG
jgi:hypothetical protein